ncbi:MAG: hypothetical protein KC421_22110 [Anaerolineales bacterium]|nr:hypothetical protein [Anaerolineales bacterium]
MMAKKRKKKSFKKPTKNKNNPSQFTIDKRLPIVGIPVNYDPQEMNLNKIMIANLNYEITNPGSNVATVANISTEILSKISTAKALFRFGFENPRLVDTLKDTWPQQWTYLEQQQLEELEKSGLPVISQSYILSEGLQINSFGEGLYYSENIPAFFDAWIEIFWQEYVVEQELRRFQELDKGQPTVTINQPNEINLQNAETWIPLENCAVRIRSMWERLHKHIVPIFFSGNSAPETTDRTYWRNLDATIKSMLNSDQLLLYTLLFQAIRNMEDSPLKNLRDALIHNLSHRPPGVLPTDDDSSNPSLPTTVGDLHQLVLEERSRLREALIIMAAIIRKKTPPNKEVSKEIS